MALANLALMRERFVSACQSCIRSSRPRNQRSRSGGEAAPIKKQNHILQLRLIPRSTDDLRRHYDRMGNEFIEELLIYLQPEIQVRVLAAVLPASVLSVMGSD